MTRPPRERPHFLPAVRWGVSVNFLAGLWQTLLYQLFPDRLDPRDWMKANVAWEPWDDEEGVWIDYLSDTGDCGRAVATLGLMVQGDLTVGGELGPVALTVSDGVEVHDGAPRVLPQGRLLIIGGDTAYSVGSEPSIRERPCEPWRWSHGVRRDLDVEPHAPRLDRRVYAIPGNHDWYDSLDGFNRLFRAPPVVDGETPLSLEGYAPAQEASYFAIRFGSREDAVCAWAVDGLDAPNDDVDYRQDVFFRSSPPARHHLIATPTPARAFDQDADWYAARSFEDGRYPLDARGADGVRLLVSGDIHHYARYSASAPNETIVQCGLGGTVVHPTHLHAPDERQAPAAEPVFYPTPERSRRDFKWKTALFGVRAVGIGLVLGALLGLGPIGAGMETLTAPSDQAPIVRLMINLALVLAGGVTLAGWYALARRRGALGLGDEKVAREQATAKRLLGIFAPPIVALLVVLVVAGLVAGMENTRQIFIELLWHVLVLGTFAGVVAFAVGGREHLRRGPPSWKLGLLGVVVALIAIAAPIAAAAVLRGEGIWIPLVAAALAGAVITPLAFAGLLYGGIRMGAFPSTAGAFARDAGHVAFLRLHLSRDGVEAWAIAAETCTDKALADVAAGRERLRAKVVDHFTAAAKNETKSK